MLNSHGYIHAPILIVKSTPALPLLAVSLAVSFTVLLAGCGQTGALYLPKPAVAKAKKTDAELGKPGVAPPAAPVPSTPPASQQ
jgi:predicted small lipoprotein YifL